MVKNSRRTTVFGHKGVLVLPTLFPKHIAHVVVNLNKGGSPGFHSGSHLRKISHQSRLTEKCKRISCSNCQRTQRSREHSTVLSLTEPFMEKCDRNENLLNVNPGWSPVL